MVCYVCDCIMYVYVCIYVCIYVYAYALLCPVAKALR